MRVFLKLWHCRIIYYVLAGFKTIILCSVHSIRFVKYDFFTKIWFVKTANRIVKYGSRIVKSNPKVYSIIYTFTWNSSATKVSLKACLACSNFDTVLLLLKFYFLFKKKHGLFWLQNVIIPFKNKIIEKPQKFLLPSQRYSRCSQKF